MTVVEKLCLSAVEVCAAITVCAFLLMVAALAFYVAFTIHKTAREKGILNVGRSKPGSQSGAEGKSVH